VSPTLDVSHRAELIACLVWRDFRLRHQGSALGVLWSLLLPLSQLIVLVFLFQRVVPLGIDAYPAFVLSGLLPWTWFSTTLAGAGALFVGNRDLVRRPGFEPAILVVVDVLANVVGFLISLPLLLVLLLFYGHGVGASLLLLPLLMLIQAVLLVGLGLAVATANVFYRDVQNLVTVSLTLLFYLTPVFYRPQQAGDAYRFVHAANPMAMLVTSYRDVLFLDTTPSAANVAGAAAFAVALLVAGALLHRAQRHEIVDRL
jgi:ABC-type polysaccharide/polyol phosphate export permease